MRDNTAIDSSSAHLEQHAPEIMGRPGLFSATDAAASLGVSERTIRRAIARGELTATKQGRSFAITLESLDRYRARQNRVGGRCLAPFAEPQPPSPAAPPLIALPRKE